jgi:tubulin-tyrosine ligase family protein
MNPLLIQGKKFDIRCYMLISSVKPLIVLYHSGYIRLSMFDFDANDGNLLTHLTNQVTIFFFLILSIFNFSICKKKIQNIMILKKTQHGLWNNSSIQIVLVLFHLEGLPDRGRLPKNNQKFTFFCFFIYKIC